MRIVYQQGNDLLVMHKSALKPEITLFENEFFQKNGFKLFKEFETNVITNDSLMTTSIKGILLTLLLENKNDLADLMRSCLVYTSRADSKAYRVHMIPRSEIIEAIFKQPSMIWYLNKWLLMLFNNKLPPTMRLKIPYEVIAKINDVFFPYVSIEIESQQANIYILEDEDGYNADFLTLRNPIQIEDAALPQKKSKGGYVYFVKAGNSTYVKIGFTTDVEGRLKTLQTGCAEKLKLMTLIPGTIQDERSYHRLFAKDRILKSEWFNLSPHLNDFIANKKPTKKFSNISEVWK